MITETLTYVDFGGTERTEDFYFNLTEAEVLNLSLSKEGGMAEKTIYSLIVPLHSLAKSKNQLSGKM